MASCTAMAFLGVHHPYTGGIQIMRMLRLYENDQTRICIERPSAYNRDGQMLGLWCCSHNVLDDMMLMGALYALKDEKVIAACREAGCADNTLEKPWELITAEDKLPDLYALSRAAYEKSHSKLVLISLTGSTMERFVAQAKDYAVDLELCPAAFERNSFRW